MHTRRERPPSATPAPSLSRLVRACVLGFAGLELIAMHLYPGGTFWDRTTRGARFWQNFLCDFESPVALDGQPNLVGARFGRAAMVLMVVGLASFWWMLPWRFGRLRRLGCAVRSLGLVSLGGILAAALMPSSRFGVLHGIAVVVAGVPGLTAAALAVAGLARAEARPSAAAMVGGGMLTFAVADFAMYARTMLHGGPGPILLPVAQKVALLLLMVWMLVIARDRRGSGRQ
jgi:hypothetical protein